MCIVCALNLQDRERTARALEIARENIERDKLERERQFNLSKVSLGFYVFVCVTSFFGGFVVVVVVVVVIIFCYCCCCCCCCGCGCGCGCRCRCS
jgi:hypothetical protein